MINEYLRSEDYTFVGVAQRGIDDAYLADMAKYATPAETVRITAVYKSIPSQLARENHKFQYKFIKSGALSSVYELPFAFDAKANGYKWFSQMDTKFLLSTFFQDS